jgi:hypothetical protein
MIRKRLVKGRKILVNKVRCRKCGTVLNSVNPDDILYCRCGEVWISGGLIKTLRGGELAFTEEQSVFA